jgi:hypothetical protein
LAPFAVENVLMRETLRNVIAWWHRQSAYAKKQLLIRTGAVAVGVVIGSIIVAKLTWGSRGPGLVTPLAFVGLFLAAAILFVLAVLSSEELVDEMEASRPPRVRQRGVYPREIRRQARFARRSLAAWLAWVGPKLRRALTRESIAQWGRDVIRALRGVPPPGTPPVKAGPLARPVRRRRSLPAVDDAGQRVDRGLRLTRGDGPAEVGRRRLAPGPNTRGIRRPAARTAARRRDPKGSGLRA